MFKKLSLDRNLYYILWRLRIKVFSKVFKLKFFLVNMKIKIKKIAIANRGEIAVRLISACSELGITPVLLYSSADKDSYSYRLSPEKVCIGPGDPKQSYLNVSAVIEGARKAKADALHPGYGFLSEKARLAKACRQNNIVFIGPPETALTIFEDKIKARKVADECGLPILPAKILQSQPKTSDFLTDRDFDFNKPFIIKALKGGGGRGIRIIHSKKEGPEQLLSAQREAKVAFGSSEMFLEQYLPHARHIEVQVFVSAKGKAFCLFDRDCSVQRKHQKIIEEAPANLPNYIKQEMADSAIRLFKTVHYKQAGTVEFLYHKEKFYFLEVNPRIQVEHPVTEAISGVDLIKAQILTAQGIELNWSKKHLQPRGHSLQCRFYAEDMMKQVPLFGALSSCYFPHRTNTRFDMGYESQDVVPDFYDSMLGKLIVHDENRELARQKMKQALSETVIFGLKTNISFLQDLISHKKFIKGEMYTRFVEDEFLKTWKEEDTNTIDPAVLSAVVKAFKKDGSAQTLKPSATFNPWSFFT